MKYKTYTLAHNKIELTLAILVRPTLIQKLKQKFQTFLLSPLIEIKKAKK